MLIKRKVFGLQLVKSIGESLQEWIILNCPYEDIKQQTLQDIKLRKTLNNRGAKEK